MRILTFTSLFPNREKPVQGIFIFQRLAEVAERPENHVEVIAPIPYVPRWLRWTRWKIEARVPRKEKVGGLSVYHPRYPLLPKISMPLHGLLMFLGCWSVARRLSAQERFDCIDAHFVYPDGFAAVLLGKVLKIPVVVSARGTDINLYPAFRWIRPLISWTLKNAAGLIAVSDSLRNVMLGLGAPSARVRVIGNGIDPKRFHPIETTDARRELGLPVSGEIVVSVGALVPRKGFHFLVPAIAQIAPRFPNVRLYILGEGDYRSQLEALIPQHRVQDHVILVGAVPNEQLRFWFGAANVSCLASSREGWANVLQESLACGTPVVATRVWGAPEVISSPGLGLLVEQNTRDIASALELALTTKWDREAIAKHAAQRTWASVANEVEEFLFSIIQSRAASGRSG